MIYKKRIFGLPPGFLALSLSAKMTKVSLVVLMR